MRSWFRAKLGRIRVSTAVLAIAFMVLFWVQQTFPPEPAPEPPAPAVVPPGFVPDPNYTWVPRTQVRRPREPTNTTTRTTITTTTTTTTTTPPSETTTSPTDVPPPSTTVIDPDGIGPLPPQTLMQVPETDPNVPPTETPPTSPLPGVVPPSPEAPR
ncbi:hypothetical protein CQY20_06975 [Mycolicibacterium agri]|uniref:Proline rich protein n=1 Tax=Mycolicibacterium agri TaxID=36811 RepID=A0A2A7N9Y1_MYCAG|nr:hypothetical protein [Mycolicibacterium agri]PEG40666.1 hypothetical protein CQY20_06975 [Mycolicibacterium agri]GFG50416.1 hypothetical protein MAGR_18570 [Mycolicibacterium agri]